MRILFLLLALALAASRLAAGNALVIQTDFGTKDGAVAAMKGIAFGVSATLPIHDLSQENTPYDIWEAAYRLKQTAEFWPAGTVFVSVIDPGVGTERASVVLQTKSGHFFVGPDTAPPGFRRRTFSPICRRSGPVKSEKARRSSGNISTKTSGGSSLSQRSKTCHTPS